MTRPQGSAAAFIAAAAATLHERRAEVDRLNVFPVPDGDTGTNMSLTMDAVLAELDALPDDAGLDAVCRAVSHGSLMGARGNSGVILSQVLRGLCETVAKADGIGPELVASSLARATEVAFQAVRKPVEGTMLTVLRDTAEAAARSAARGADLPSMSETIVAAAYDSVRRTPELLPILKETGVVDAGGLGLALLVEGFAAAFEGKRPTAARSFAAPVKITVTAEDDWSDTEHLYCTEFLMFSDRVDQATLEERVAGFGGSVLVVGGDDEFKIHVHTDDPGSVLAYATSLGEVAEVHINNMRRQTEARAAAIEAQRASSAPAKPVGFVAVAAGEGLADILLSLGVDVVVSGGQTMNPSTAELLEAVRRVNAETVILLPDNRNIVLAAQQAAPLADRQVAVVPTTSVPEGFSAMLAFDPDATLDENVGAMTVAAESVRTGEVTVAIKDSRGKAGEVRAGQVIGISAHEIEVIGDDVEDVTLRLLDAIAEDADTLTLLWGADLSDEQAAAIEASVRRRHPGLETESHRGGQPLYPVVLSVE